MHSRQFRLSLDGPNDLTIREYRPGDEVAILAAFNRLFARVDPGFVPRSIEAWRWRFRDVPGRARIFLAVDAGGCVLAQYAGIPQRARVEGEPAHFSHVVDSFCDPSVRGGLARRGLFARTGERYAAAFAGVDSGRDRLVWGRPMPAAWRVGRERLGYQYLADLWFLERDARSGPAPARDVDGVDVVEVSGFPVGLDALYERCAEERVALVARDRTWLQWRYAAHPERPYRVAVATRVGELAGYAVYRSGRLDGRERGLVCDWLVPSDDDGVAAALRSWLDSTARELGAPGLAAVFPAGSPEFLAFQAAGWRVAPSGTFLAARSFERRRDVAWYAENLYYTLGDTDLV